MILSCVLGTPSRFILGDKADELHVTNTRSGQVHLGPAVRERAFDADPLWRIKLTNGAFRYFNRW